MLCSLANRHAEARPSKDISIISLVVSGYDRLMRAGISCSAADRFASETQVPTNRPCGVLPKLDEELDMLYNAM